MKSLRMEDTQGPYGAVTSIQNMNDMLSTTARNRIRRIIVGLDMRFPDQVAGFLFGTMGTRFQHGLDSLALTFLCPLFCL